MTYEQLLAVYQKAHPGPVDGDTFNAWTRTLPGGEGGDWSKITTATPGTNVVQVPGSTGGTTPATGFTGLVTPNVTAAVDPATATTTGGNYNQTQNSNQGGTFGTVGSTNQDVTQNQTQTGTTAGTQQNTGTQTTSGTNAQNTTTGNTSSTAGLQSTIGQTTGTSTTGVNDTLGFGNLLQGAAGAAQTNDTNRNAFLNDVMSTGGQQFGSQVDQAVRNSLTGPQMTGAGDSARARAAGYAGAEVGRNNLNSRLAAAQQLTGPTGLTSLASSATPYLGSTTANTGSSMGNTSTLGSQVDSGFSSLLGSNTGQTLTDMLQKNTGSSTGATNVTGSTNTNEAQTGATAAASSQAGAGQIPEGQPVKTGGCVLCTAGIALKLPKSKMHRILRRVIKHKLHVEPSRFSSASRGYFFLFTPFARFLLVHRWIASLLWPLARAVVYEELRVSGKRIPFRAVAWFTHWLGHCACVLMGQWVRDSHVTDPVILGIARRENILFEIKEIA